MNTLSPRTTKERAFAVRGFATAQLLTLLAFAGLAAAQTSPNGARPDVKTAGPAAVAVTPASVDAKVRPCVSYTQNFSVVNGTGERIKVRMSAEDVWVDDQNKRIEGRAGTLPRSASPWLTFTPAEFTVEPFGTGTVKGIISVPGGAAGSFYTVPVFEVSPAEKVTYQDVSTNVTTARAAIGLKFRGIVSLTTETGSEYNVEVMDARVTPPTATSELELSLGLRNGGNAHAKVRGTFAILDASGNMVGKGSIDEKKLLPMQRKILKSEWSGELKPGKYTALVTLSHDRVGTSRASLGHEISFEVK